jgi:Zn-dependent M28 family amino/carboxypeptidase
MPASGAPKRSILLLACTGEEEGLWGSMYFAERPIVDVKQIVANINLEMFLPLFPLKVLRGYGVNESDLKTHLESAAKDNGL